MKVIEPLKDVWTVNCLDRTFQVHCNSIITRSYITRSLLGSQIFFQYTVCENVSGRQRYTQCKLRKSYYMCISQPSLTPVNLPRGYVNYTQIYFPYSTVTSACQGSGQACTRNVLHICRNEINTVNQLQLHQSTNVNLLIPRFMKSLCVITIELNTLLADVPYQMTVGGAFVYVCEVALKILNNGRVYITRSVIMHFFPWTPMTAL